ncbi:MAG: sodium:proton antiporter [Candidatus Eremiobacteraeota bacterium]|nr:sodium:proton antiporter [Candidatus Eremiobacteraeota bacterium]
MGLQDSVGFVVAILGVALIVSVIAERLGIPYVVALLVVAAPVEIPNLPEHFAPVLLFVFLPALVFEAAWNVDGRALKRRWLAVTVLALPGVIVTAFLVGGGLALAKQLPFGPALLLGTILAATDPVAVIAVFRRLDVPTDLETIVGGESLFNDGAAIVLYGVVVSLLHGSAQQSIWAVTWSFFAIAAGGAAIGFIVAALVARLLRGSIDGPLQVVGTIVAAFGSYLLADRLHLSGIFAAVVAGIAMRAFPRFPTKEAVADVDRFWAVLAFLANAIVFVLMGIRIEFVRVLHEPVLVLLTLAFVTLARVLLGYVVLPLAGARVAPGWRSVVALSGMRGAVSIALAIGLPADIPMRPMIVDAVFGVVLVTLVAQGLAIGPVISRLKLAVS